MTELDRKLQEIAAKDWEQFVKLLGEKKLIAAKVCYLRRAGNSYGKISLKLKITERQAEHACLNCQS